MVDNIEEVSKIISYYKKVDDELIVTYEDDTIDSFPYSIEKEREILKTIYCQLKKICETVYCKINEITDASFWQIILSGFCTFISAANLSGENELALNMYCATFALVASVPFALAIYKFFTSLKDLDNIRQEMLKLNVLDTDFDKLSLEELRLRLTNTKSPNTQI